MFEIYLITNQINEMLYVGQTTQGLKRRFRDHLRFSKQGSGTYLGRAIRKYGGNRFTISLLATAKDREELTCLEIFWIKTLKTKYPYGYNLTEGGEGCSGFVRSDENRKKMSEVMKGKLLGKSTGESSPHFIHNLDIERIASLYQEGKTLIQISKLLGVSAKTVGSRLKSSGIGLRSNSAAHKILLSNPENHPMYREDLSTKDMVSLLEKRLTNREIAKRLGCSLGCVSKRLRREGRSRLHNRTGVDVDAVVSLYLGCGSVQKTAKEFAVSTSTVHRILTSTGTPRTRGKNYSSAEPFSKASEIPDHSPFRAE